MTDEDQAPVDLTPEQEQVQERRVLEALDREGELAQLKALLTQEPMRDFLWRVLSQAGVYKSTFKHAFGDMAFAEGARNLGLWLLSEIVEADPNAEMLMRQKANRVSHDELSRERQKKLRRRNS